MSIIAKLKSVLGIGGGRDRDRGTRVAVEQEPATDSERAVKESPPEPEVEPPSTAEESREPAETEESEPAGSDEPVDTIKGIGDAYAERLAEAGIETVADLAGSDAAELADSTGLGEGRLEGWIERAAER